MFRVVFGRELSFDGGAGGASMTGGAIGGAIGGSPRSVGLPSSGDQSSG